MEALSNNKRHTFTYIFRHEMMKVLHLVRDWQLTQEIMKKANMHFEKLEMIIGKTTWEIGSEFFVETKAQKCFFRTIDYIEDQQNSKIQWFVFKTEPVNVEYMFTCNFFRDVTNTYTTVILTWEYMTDLPAGFDTCNNQERQAIFALFDEFLNKETKLKKHKVSMEIKTSFENAKKVLYDLKLLQKKVPILCSEVKYEGLIEKGKEVVFLTQQDDVKAMAVLKVKSIKDDGKKFRILYEMLKSDPPVPRQEIEWKLICEGEFSCKIKLNHYYYGFVKEEVLKTSKANKKKVLSYLKFYLENL